MRDVERIDKFCNELAKQWKKYPDFRFGQMMINIFSDMVSNGVDPFFPEEDKMMKYIDEYMSRWSK